MSKTGEYVRYLGYSETPCPECGYESGSRTRYCPNCGAKMDAEVNDHGSDPTEHAY